MPHRRAERLALALLVLPLAAAALESDRQQPMQIAADYSEATLGEAGTALLRGNVQIVQGSLQIDAERARVERGGGAIRRVLLEGAPARIEQDLDSGGRMQAHARSIDYDLGADVLVLSGAVLITQPEGELRGERVRYHLASGRLEGGSEGGRIQMRIEPRPPATSD